MPYKDRDKMRAYQRKWHKARRQKGIEYLGGKCKSCGGTENLEFHHRNPEEKFTHKIFSYRWETIHQELNKCDLLCQRCHKLITYGETEPCPF